MEVDERREELVKFIIDNIHNLGDIELSESSLDNFKIEELEQLKALCEHKENPIMVGDNSKHIALVHKLADIVGVYKSERPSVFDDLDNTDVEAKNLFGKFKTFMDDDFNSNFPPNRRKRRAQARRDKKKFKRTLSK